MPPKRRARAGALSLALWAGIIVTGRMIAYNWFDCDLQPQPAFVNWAAGCVVPQPSGSDPARCTLLSFFEWCEATALGSAIRESMWLFPVIESVHLLALAVLGGAILLVDLRLLGLGLTRHPVARLARDVQPWLVGSILVMLATGISLFLSEAVKCYYSTPFWVKMSTLPVALLFTATVRRRVVAADETRARPLVRKLVGVVSILLWFTVAAAGRWIGFSG